MLAKISVDQALIKAKFHAKNNNIIEAKKLYESVLLAFPKNVRAKQGLASLNITKQLNVIKTPLQEKIDHLLNIYNQHKFEAVVDQANNILTKYPEAIVIWNILAITNLKLRKVKQALEAFKKVTLLNPNYAKAHNSLGNILKELGQLNEAEESYTKAIILEPEIAEFHSNLGLIKQELGKFEEAETSYIKAIMLNPKLAEPYINFGKMLLDQNRFDEAETNFTKAINFHPNKFPDAYDQLAFILQKKGDFDKAELFYKKCINLDPNKITKSKSRGYIFFKERLFEQALNCFESYNNVVSRAQTLETLYALNRIDDIYKRLESKPDLYENNLRVAAIAAFLNENEKKVPTHNFCNNPLEFIHFGNLNTHTKNYTSFISSIINDLSNVKTRWETNTTKNGFQAKTDIFKNSSKNIKSLEVMIINELNIYHSKYKNETCTFIQNWPSEININGWHVILKHQGHQTAHIHPNGWLSGVIYLKVVPSLEQNEGAIEFSLDGPNYQCKSSKKIIYQPNLGDMVFFPSSLFHKTLPFSTNTDRICIAFDLLPKAEKK